MNTRFGKRLGQNKWLNGQALIHDHACKPFCTNSKKLEFVWNNLLWVLH